MINIKQKVSTLVALAVLSVAAVAALPATPLYADAAAEIRKGANKTGVGNSNVTVDSAIQNITNALLFVLGFISVIMIIVGGIRFATSNGSAEQIKSAKNIIMYAVIGLVVALLAYAIVNFVVDALV